MLNVLRRCELFPIVLHYFLSRCGSLWILIVVDCGGFFYRCGLLWIVVGRCRSFPVLVSTPHSFSVFHISLIFPL